MESHLAAEHLQVIRTLMERSAVYRRALAPVMIYAGVVGLTAAVIGRVINISSPVSFVAYWYAVAVVAVAGVLLLVRRQAWKEAEPFWSPPARRVAQATLPALTAGCLVGVLLLVLEERSVQPAFAATGTVPGWYGLIMLPCAWAVLYGCALHAAGFFMPRGVKLFGWILILGGLSCVLISPASPQTWIGLGHGLMGAFFGVLHLAYGVYLYFTESRRNVS